MTQMVNNFCNAITTRYKDKYLQLPTKDEMREYMNVMEQSRGIPQCIGAIDGKHFGITNGAKQNLKYNSTKKVPSFVRPNR